MDPDVKPVAKSRKVKQLSMREHVKTRSMWAGSKNTQTIETYVLSKTEHGSEFTMEPLQFPPAFLKIFDEILVNALDHYVLNPKMVTEIRVTIDPSGEISVMNNGPGIVIELTKNANGVAMYTPQLIFGEFMAGSNFNSEDEGSRIVGGQNGIGSKLTVVFSKWFKVETVDNGQLYTQVFLDGLTKTEEPTIVPTKSKPYTKISFMPDYDEFKLKIEKFYPTLAKIVEARAWYAAAYTNASVYYCGKKIPLKSFEDFCQMFSENLVYRAVMKRPKSHDWEVCFAVSDGKERNLSIVNGVHVPKGGTHIDYIQNQLVANIRERVEKEIKKSGIKFNKNYIINNTFIFMKGPIPSPEFMSQTKEAISDPIEKFAGYSLSTNEWTDVWDLLKPAILATFLKKQLGEVKTRANRSKVDVPKYKEAKFCKDKKKYINCGLIVTEGDSASGTADTGLLAKASPSFNYDWFGVFSIGGVPMNGLKESNELKQTKKKSADDEVILRGKKAATKIKRASDDLQVFPKRIPNKKLQLNERISSLIKVLGLDFNKSYDMSEIGEKEYSTLRYGYMCSLTDQDLDGYNIFGLVATFIITYWPALLQRGFIRRINTPIIRAYPSKNKKLKVKEFYSQADYKTWIESLSEKEIARYTIHYYKGLGSHKQAFKEVTQMFKNIENKIRTYIFDNEALKNMYIYYGTDTAPRKVALATPVTEEPTEALMIPMSEQFKIDTKLYQRDNIIRKLLNTVDGFVASRRKVFYVTRLNGRKEIKVQGLAGKAVSDANYHHGEASLEQTIVRMAQGYPMARNLPLLLPLGNYGTRSKGYKDAAASRYIFTTLNYRLADKLFRREDEYILEYEMEDGKRYEPKYYVPIIPYVLCEDNILPATGWKISIHARNINDIFANARNMIKGITKKCMKLSPWCKDFKGKIKTYKNRQWYVGVYNYDSEANTVHITELPPGIFSNAYLKGSGDEKISKKKEEKKGIQTKEWIEDFEDNTTLESVDILIQLKPGAYEEITADNSAWGNAVFDPFEEYFELKEPIYHNINLVNENYEVVEYKNYEDVFNDWFTFRKNLYGIRVEREIILTNLEIKMLKFMQQFSKEHDKFQITNKTSDETAYSILKSNKYAVFNHTRLENPKFTSIANLVDLITKEEHGASYSYILDRMSYRDLTEAAYAKREQRIADLSDRMKYLLDDEGLFRGAKIWLHELDELETAIKDGIASGWFYGENDYEFE